MWPSQILDVMLSQRQETPADFQIWDWSFPGDILCKFDFKVMQGYGLSWNVGECHKKRVARVTRVWFVRNSSSTTDFERRVVFIEVCVMHGKSRNDDLKRNIGSGGWDGHWGILKQHQNCIFWECLHDMNWRKRICLTKKHPYHHWRGFSSNLMTWDGFAFSSTSRVALFHKHSPTACFVHQNGQHKAPITRRNTHFPVLDFYAFPI